MKAIFLAFAFVGLSFFIRLICSQLADYGMGNDVDVMESDYQIATTIAPMTSVKVTGGGATTNNSITQIAALTSLLKMAI